MGRIPAELVARVRACLVGLSEGDQLAEVGRIVRADIVGGEIAMRHVERPSIYFTDLSKQRRPGAAAGGVVTTLSAADQEMVKRCGLDPAKVGADLARERREEATRARQDGPLRLTDDEAAMVRRMGHDPRMVAAMHDGASFEDWKRLKAAGGAS